MILSDMRLHRFILDIDLGAERLDIADREATNQIRNVLRLEAGDRFIVCDGKGKEATVQIVSADGVVVADVLDRREVASENAARVILYCAVLKRENFELVVQKATECGAAAIVPVISTRTVKLGIKRDRLEKIAREAAEQSGRGVVPAIEDPMSLKNAITHAKDNATNVLFEPGAPPFVPTSYTLHATPSLGLFIGPEGGWDDAEVEQLRAAGYHVAGLGPRVLRAETAAIVTSFIATSYV